MEIGRYILMVKSTAGTIYDRNGVMLLNQILPDVSLRKAIKDAVGDPKGNIG